MPTTSKPTSGSTAFRSRLGQYIARPLGLVAVALCFGYQTLNAQTIAEGAKLIDLEQVQKAEAHFAGMVAKAPTAEHYYYLGATQLLNDQTDKARQNFEAGIAKDPNYALNYVGKGALILKEAKPNEASAKLEEAKALFNKAVVTSKSKSAEVFYEIGRAYISFDTKDGVSAITALRTATTASPRNPDYWLRLGDAFMVMNDGTEANNAYNKAQAVNPNYAKTYIKLGTLMERARNYNEAIAKYKEGIAKEPGYWPAYRELGELYDRARRTKEGFEYFDRYIQNSDRNPLALNKYADFLIKLGEYQKAIDVLKEIEAKVKNPLIYRGFAYAELETKAYKEGLAHDEQFFALADPKFVQGRDYRTYGKLLIASGTDTVRGIEMLKKAYLKDSTGEYPAVLGVSRTFNDQKAYRFVALINGFLDSVGKMDAIDYLNYGRALHNLKRYQEADTVFGKLTQKYNTYLTGFYWRAYNSARLDPNSETWLAQPHYEKFATLVTDPEKFKPFLKPTYRYLISYYLIHERNKERTLEYADKLLALDPADQAAKDAKAHDFSKPLPKAKPAAPKPTGKK